MVRLKIQKLSSTLGGHGYRAGVVPAVLLYQVLREALHGGKVSSCTSFLAKYVTGKTVCYFARVLRGASYLPPSLSSVPEGSVSWFLFSLGAPPFWSE